MEHQLFKAGLEAHGKRWADVARFMGTRTDEQVHGYAAAAQDGATAKGTRAATAAAMKSKKRARTTAGHGGKDNNEGSDNNSSKAAKKPPAPVAVARRAPTTTSKKARGPKDGHWTEEEHQLFLECWHKYGKAWKTIADVMKTRSNEQIRTHAQKYFTKLEQLRHCGYEGDYTMDGTRHLTKAFVTKAQKAGRVGSGGYVNPLGAEKGRGNAITTSTATTTASGPPSRCSARTRKVAAPPATAKAVQAEARSKAGGMELDQEVPAPAPLSIPIAPLSHDVPDCHHAAAPASAMAALAEDLPATAAGSTTATAGSESDKENDNDEALYGDMGSLLDFSDGDDDNLDVPAEIVEGSILDFSAFMTGCHQEEGGKETGEGGSKGAGALTTDSVASTIAANLAVPGAILIGADGPTHDEDVLAPLLDTSNGANSADCCDSSIAAWGIEDETTNESEVRPPSAVGAVPFIEHRQHQQQAHEHGHSPMAFFQAF
jgi:SHAQKYF class myb-like DNA-binding protein